MKCETSNTNPGCHFSEGRRQGSLIPGLSGLPAPAPALEPHHGTSLIAKTVIPRTSIRQRGVAPLQDTEYLSRKSKPVRACAFFFLCN